MKKSRGILVAILTVVLSVAMFMGTMTVGAFADYSATNITGGDAPATFVSSLEYGEPVDLSGAKSVVEPNGNEVTTGLNAYKPLQIGAYTVYYGDYSYVVSCKLDKDYELRVENNGADIATYLTTGGTLKLPKASVWVEDEDSFTGYKELTGSDYVVKVKVVGVGEEMVADKENTVELKSAQAYNVHYYCEVKGGTKYLYKNYTVKVQDDFTDTTAPTLNVVNIPSEISLNTKVTLPKATATDTYDSNVKVSIKVEEYDKETGAYTPVKEVKLDDDGYALPPAADAKDVVFENDYNLSFYPTKLTTYRVTYSAVDDNGNNSTGVHSYTTTAVDKTGPVLKKIADDKIPTKWGINGVTNEKKDADAVSTVVNFPYPEYVDNANGNITVIFEIKDTVNNQTVIRFSNINDYTENEDGTYVAGNNAKYSYDSNRPSQGLYQNGTEPLVFDRVKGLDIDFSKYVENIGEGKTATGTYTVSYQARDSVPNITTKTYDITLEDTFSDTEKPDIKDLTFDDHYVVTGNKQEITIPSVRVSDNADTRPTVKYELISGTNSIEVDGGEDAELVLDGITPKLLVYSKTRGDQELVLGATLNYKITAIDDAQNENYKTRDNDIKIASSLAAPNAIDGTNLTTSKQPEQGDKIEAGSFTWEVPAELREFYGFELSLVRVNDGKGELETANNISFLTYHDGTTVHVENIEFVAPVADSVDLYVRVFNAAGASITTKASYTIQKPNTEDDTIKSAANISTGGTVYTSYILQNTEVDKPEGINENRKYVVRKITGQGKFNLMGNQFSAYNAGTFYFVDGYFKGGSTATDGEFTPLKKNSEYRLAVTETATPVWQIQGEMPTYTAVSTKDKKETVVLPQVVASTDYANARIVLSVKHSDDSTPLTVSPSKEESAAHPTNYKVNINEKGQYYFEPTKDGTYTVTYTAYYGSNSEISQSFEIKAGDVIAPSFTVKEHNARATENSKFKFNEVTLTSSEDLAALSSVKYKKVLKAPDGSEVYTVEGYGETYRKATTPTDGDEYTFNKIGNYTVEYTTYDKVGNSSVRSYTITVTAAKVNNPISTKIISTILIIVGVLLIAGVILYFVRFRKVKSK